ncbi:hypothetical protein MBLNU13_g02127t1 [Cladosporium sp. NU13]
MPSGQQTHGRGLITAANHRSHDQTPNLSKTRLHSRAQMLKFLFINHRKKIQDIAISPTIYHRHRPQQQQIRPGRNKAIKQRLGCVYASDISPVTDLNQIDMQPEPLRSVVRNLAVGLRCKARRSLPNSCPNIHQGGFAGRNIHVPGALRRVVGNAGCTAYQDDLGAKVRPGEAGGGCEALKERLAKWCGDSNFGRHVSAVQDEVVSMMSNGNTLLA